MAFPLGELTKGDVRQLAREAGLAMAEKPDSQDFYSGDANELLGTSDRPGEILSADGKVLGHHSGYWHFTVGQRQGLGIGGGTPYYVIHVDACRNRVVVGRRDEAIRHTFNVQDLNWQGVAETDDAVEGFVKIRSNGPPAGRATLAHGAIHAPDGLFGVAPGQSAVLYSADGAILCGGIVA